MKRMLDQKLIDFLNSLGDSLKYESSSNTFEIGTNLYVDGKLEINDDTIFKGNLDAYNDSLLTFYQGNNAQSIYMAISPLYDETKLAFLYNDGQAITTSIELDVSVNSNILTDKNVKTLFGNHSLYGSGNIDLYKHYLKITGKKVGDITQTFYILVQSSSNTDCSSETGATQKLQTLLKASGTETKIYESGITSDCSAVCTLFWNGAILFIVSDTERYNITSIDDRVETL